MKVTAISCARRYALADLHIPMTPHTPHHTTYFAVLADRLNALAFGAPFAPALRIRSPLPAAIRLRFALMLLYSPGLAMRHHFVLLAQ